ncbi:Calcium-binding EF-hand [Corchorus olitorius]|uniref:Calcium-binding EF-hand n=1 Tax=Corchorus olitorius TaxID=93759 RepID=A0A1R3JKM0_9ROSI|nr:Calcium-binding EF-hand [Corchorus olitorius]
MEEMRETVQAYFAKLPESQKHEATKFFNSLDNDGDGKITVEEFMGWVKQRGFKSINRYETIFKELDKHENGTLDFDEVLMLFYLYKSGRFVFCDGCGAFIKGVYFTCLKCFNAGKSAEGCDLCCSCYGGNNFNHRADHATFVDSHALLISIWRHNKPSSSAAKQVELIGGAFEFADALVNIFAS